MRTRKGTIAVLCAALCVAFAGCGGEDLQENPETKQEETESAQTELAELSGAYLQMALYIQEGFRVYHVEGEYQAYFGPIEGVSSGIWVDGRYIGTGDETQEDHFQCDILLEGEEKMWREKLAFSYDAETDWYVFSGQYEPILAGNTSWSKDGDTYAKELLKDYVCRAAIARDMDSAAAIRYDSEGGPIEKTLWMDQPWFFREEGNGLSYQIRSRAYHYWDERLDVCIDIQYPQLEMEDGQEELEEAVNAKLREAFFYGYGWGEEGDGPLDPSQEMYTDIERTYLITREDERYLSMRIYEYNSDRYAAHPNQWETSITLDMRTGEAVRLEDVFGEDEVESLTLGDLLERGDFRCLWMWMPGGEGWIEELKEDYGDDPLRRYESDFYLTDTGFGLITYMYNEYTCLEAEYEKLGIEGF